MAFVSSFSGTRTLGQTKNAVASAKTTEKKSGVVMVTKAPGRSAVFDKFMASQSPWGKMSLASIGKKAETVVARTTMQVKTLCDADDYIAQCMKRQYVGLTQSGVYNVTCTEGASSYAAEDARVAALAAEFRKRQVSTVTSFGDLFEARKIAYASAKMCGYEESLVKRFGKSAETFVIGASESMGACSRYAMPSSVEEKYMMDCVIRASSARATENGCYSVMCSDGTVSGAAESKRVRGLSVEFRNKQVSPIVSSQWKFNQSKAAFYGCEYEDGLFAKYPAVAAAMRPSYARY